MFALMSRLRNAKLRGERGAVAVEFALVVPILLLFLFSLVSVSRAFQVQATISAAAREAARTMALENNSGAARARAVEAAGFSSLTLSPGRISIEPSTCTNKPPRTNVTVTIDYQFQPMGSFAGGIAFPITATAVMRCGG